MEEKDFITENENITEIEADEALKESLAESYENSRKPKKRFGFLRWIGKILVIVILITVAFTFGRLSAISGKNGMSAITTKLSVLNSYVDYFFLFDVDQEKLANSVYSGYMNGLGDKYSCYYTEEEYKQLMEEDSGEYRGIGVTVFKDTTTNYVMIESVVKGGPADESGLLPEDAIISVDGEDVVALTLNEVVSRIKSPDTDTTDLQIYRASENKVFEVTITKSTIQLESVSYEMKKDNTGYISVNQFLENTDEKFINAVNDLNAQGMTSLIIDLRDNGGGLLDTCVNMLSRIVPKDELLVYTQNKQGKQEDINSNSEETLDIPIVILVNGNSASASEIFTGCLKDYEIAKVVGTTTYGKGIVQSIMPLSDGTAIKMTISEYYTPKGYEVHGNGITPDEVVELTEEEIKALREDSAKDKQLDKAFEVLKNWN